MQLVELLDGVAMKSKGALPLLDITDVTDDSRSAGPGGLFVAVVGESVDGHRFINDAIARGVAAVVSQGEFDPPRGVAKILVRDSRSALAQIADNFYGHPSDRMKVVGVTGTNGKTTITYIMENIVKRSGGHAGVIGTVNYRIKARSYPAKNTTPGSLELERLFSSMVKEGVGYAIMEVSSHSLDQKRVDGIKFDAGIFTNLTGDHLDYHKTVDSYFKAKAAIFDRLKDGGTAILNADDPKVASLKGKLKARTVTFGIRKPADVSAKHVRLMMDSSEFTVAAPHGSFEIRTHLVGLHNVSNILASIAASMAIGIGRSAIKDGIESFKYVPGRLEPVEAGQPFKVLVDYAHTEDALFNVLSVLRQLANKRRIITVFGCGGDRDRTKRPLMGRVACKFSDSVIITSDNPRSEEPLEIIGQIEKGVKGRFRNYTVIEDRRSAIERALSLAGSDDIVLIAGKGHENYQIIKGHTHEFDDRQVARKALKTRYANSRARKDNIREAVVRKGS